MEKLSDYFGHDYNGCDPASLFDSKVLSGNFVYSHWPGLNLVEREIYKNLFSGEKKQGILVLKS
jgi:hypothetical protein